MTENFTREERIDNRLHPVTGWGFYRLGLSGGDQVLIAHPAGLCPSWKESNISEKEQRDLSEKVEDLDLDDKHVHWFSTDGELIKSLTLY